MAYSQEVYDLAEQWLAETHVPGYPPGYRVPRDVAQAVYKGEVGMPIVVSHTVWEVLSDAADYLEWKNRPRRDYGFARSH